MSWSGNRGKDPYPEGPKVKRQRVRVIWDPEETGPEGRALVPSMDIYEKSEFLVIEVELPGMKREDIEIYVSRDLVTIEGTKADLKVCGRDSGGRISYLQLERKLGRLKREINLPIACDTREVKATYKDGLLVVEFKKIKDRRGQRRRIPVE